MSKFKHLYSHFCDGLMTAGVERMRGDGLQCITWGATYLPQPIDRPPCLGLNELQIPQSDRVLVFSDAFQHKQIERACVP